ncbi:MAG: glycosyltransferase [Frankiaceae bacterium]|nr:glycosyltransferase [Frankiaceae bacterium]MBV9871457.1 glycosyltransferase [Frankiaceae bacterium]
MTTVAHYLERWLELSAGFVAAHVEHSRHRGVVISRDGWLNLDAFDHRPRHSLSPIRSRTPERHKARALRLQLGAVLAAERADIVHVHFGYAATDALAVTRRRPFVLSLHGHDVTGLLHDEPDRYRGVAPHVNAVIVPSQFLAATATAAGFAEDRICVVPSGVDTEFFTPTPLPDGPPVVAFVGRLIAKKGIPTLLDAWRTIGTAVPDASLELVGDGPLRGLIPTDDARITWHAPEPRRRREQVRDLIRRATVVVTPSETGPDGDSESLLLVNLEAAASGRPVVSTQHGGIPEYVATGTTGLLVPEADPGALGDAVIRVLQDRSLAMSLGEAGVPHAKQWDVRTCTSRVDDLYEELLRRVK